MTRILAAALAAALFSPEAAAKPIKPCIPEVRASDHERRAAQSLGAEVSTVFPKYRVPMARAIAQLTREPVTFVPVKVTDISTPHGSIIAFYDRCGLAQVQFLTARQRETLDVLIIGDEI